MRKSRSARRSAIAPDRFTRFAAVDWSGAKGSRHRGIALAVCEADRAAPMLVEPAGGAWSRRAILDWLIERRDEPMIVGFDFSFSAPFVARGAHLPGETTTTTARALWAYVDANSPDPDLGAASFLTARRGRYFYLGAADGKKADFLHWRVCETVGDGGRKPSTVYDAIGASQVAKASFAGMRLLDRLAGRIPVWPFDAVPDQGLVVVEIYTAIAARAAGLRKGLSKLRTPDALDAALAAPAIRSAPYPHTATALSDHATDAILTAAWLRATAADRGRWHPAAMSDVVARTEGWTFGVP